MILSESSSKEVSNRLQTLVEGARIKHTLGKASIKMYDKQDRVLRIETTVNDFTILNPFREVKHRDGSRETKYASMRKSIYPTSGNGIHRFAASLPSLRASLTSCRRCAQNFNSLHEYGCYPVE